MIPYQPDVIVSFHEYARVIWRPLTVRAREALNMSEGETVYECVPATAELMLGMFPDLVIVGDTVFRDGPACALIGLSVHTMG